MAQNDWPHFIPMLLQMLFPFYVIYVYPNVISIPSLSIFYTMLVGQTLTVLWRTHEWPIDINLSDGFGPSFKENKQWEYTWIYWDDRDTGLGNGI